MTTTRLHPAPTPVALAEILGAGLRVLAGEPSGLRVTHLDTFDWRLYRAGARLVQEREGRRRRWVWTSPGDEPARTLPVTCRVRFADDLSSGWLRQALAPLLGLRALLEVGEIDLHRQLLRVVDGDGNTALRVWWEQVSALGFDGRPVEPPRTMVRLEPLPDHDRSLDLAVELLTRAGVVEPAPADDLALAAAARGREPGDYSSKPRLELEAQQPAAKALRSMLGELLATARANLDGVQADHDTEFLHDLRVAVRRSRSALAQLQGVLPPDEVEPLVAELRWLGTATGPCRDLDVFLLDLDGDELRLEQTSPEAAALLRTTAARDRAAAHHELVGALRSDRCAELFRLWAAVAEREGVGANGSGPVRPLADQRIRRAFRRVLKQGRRLGPSPAPDQLHRLRITAKRLRYLLELFASLYEGRLIRGFVRELRRLQDLLGGVQDTVVQLQRLEALADRLVAAGTVPASILLAMGRLAERTSARQERLRAGFEERFAEFAGEPNRREFKRLLAAGNGDSPCG